MQEVRRTWYKYGSCKVFGHIHEECSKNTGAGEKKTVKKPSQTSRGVPIGPKMGFRPHNEYQIVLKKPIASPSSNMKKGVEPTIEVSNSNPFDVLNSVDNDVEFGTNGGAINLVNNGATLSGSSFMNVDNSSSGTTLIIDKIGKFEYLLTSGQDMLVDKASNPLKKVEFLGEYDSKDEVASVDNDMARSMASKRIVVQDTSVNWVLIFAILGSSIVMMGLSAAYSLKVSVWILFEHGSFMVRDYVVMLFCGLRERWKIEALILLLRVCSWLLKVHISGVCLLEVGSMSEYIQPTGPCNNPIRICLTRKTYELLLMYDGIVIGAHVVNPLATMEVCNTIYRGNPLPKKTSKAYIVLNKETMKIVESLNVTFDESFPEPKSSLLVEDDRIIEIVVHNPIRSPSLEANASDLNYPKSLKEARGHPIEQVISKLNEKTLRSKTK
ncbi:hypothetical protein Tco_1314934 [Tanacetum coccineum]